MGGIVWLASYPKSGNTWTRAFLHNLLRNPAEPVPLDRLTDFTIGTADARWYKKYTDKKIEELTAEELAEMRPKVHFDYTQAFPDSVFVKTHNFLGEEAGVPLISMQYTVGAVYVVRDPRDVCISAGHHYGLSLDDAISMLESETTRTGGNDDNVPEVLTSWTKHVVSWTRDPNPNLHVMRYEDMGSKSLETFAALARFLGLNPPRDRLKKALKYSEFRVLKRLEEKHGFRERSEHTDRFFRRGRAGGWRQTLSAEQAKRIEDAHREQMQRFGYL